MIGTRWGGLFWFDFLRGDRFFFWVVGEGVQCMRVFLFGRGIFDGVGDGYREIQLVLVSVLLNGQFRV